MTEDELLQGITEALELAGWRWFHVRRSDAAVWQGSTGWPDIFAIHPTRGPVALELKSATGQLTGEQGAWVAALNGANIPARVVRPQDYDLLLSIILGRAVA